MRTSTWFRAAVASLSLALGACSHGGGPNAAEAEKQSLAMWNRIGSELAAAANRQPASAGPVVLVREANLPGFGPGQDTMEAAVRSKLKSAAAITVITIPEMPAPTVIPLDFVPPVRLKADWLTSALQKNGPASTVISLVDEPVGDPPKDKPWPPIICYSRNGSTNLAQLIRAGVVVAAVAPRHTNPNVGSKDWFELRYTVVDKSNVDQWIKDLPARR